MENTPKITPLTDNSKKALGWLIDNPGNYMGNEVAEGAGLNARGIHAVLGGLVKRGLVEKLADKKAIEVEVEDKDGNKSIVTREYVVYALTDEGAATDLS